MAQFVNMFEVDLKQRSGPRALNQMVCEGDAQGNRIGAYVYDDGAPVTLGGACVGKVIRADGATVPLTGAISGNAAYVVLDQTSCAVEGPIQVAVCWVSGNSVTTLVVGYGTVVHTTTSHEVQPDTPIPDITELLAEIENMRAATADANAAAAAAGQYGNFIDSFVVAGVREDISTTGEAGTYWNCEGATAYKDTVAGDSFKAYDPVTVAAGEVYTIYNRSGSTHKARPYLVTDNDYHILSSPGDQYGEPTKRYIIVVPEGGTKLLLTSVNTAGPLLKKLDWGDTIDTSKAMKYRGSISALGYTSLAQCAETGYYGSGAAYNSSLADLPEGFDTTAAVTLFNVSYAFNSGNASSGIDTWHLQFLVGSNGTMYRRRIYVLEDYAYPWESMTGGGATGLLGKTVAILGDSISTNGSTGSLANVPEVRVEEADVGVTLSAYLTYYDVQAGLSLGGHTFTAAEIGTEVTFTPVAGDVGKVIGRAANFNDASTIVWWEVLMQELGINPIPNCWSGASITSHEGNTESYKTSYAWHEATIRKCGIRTPGTMERTAPDVIIIYRGTNDFSHSPYAKLTGGYFDSYNWQYPSTDVITGGYGFKEGLCLTVKKLRDAYPNAKIFLCTLNVFKRVNYSHFPTNNGANSLPQYNDAIREVANFLGCGVIDFDRDGITFENCYSEGYLNSDEGTPTHPTDKGHRVMGLKAETDLNAQYSAMN